MKEIGGYFELEHFGGKEYHEDLIALNNGRNALVYLSKAKRIKKLYIPYFLCDSVAKICDKYAIEYAFYHIDHAFMPIFQQPLQQDEYLYIVNFYGQISNEQVCKLKEMYGNVIFDNIHAFFQKPVPGIDTIYSCRKFFGVPDGGYLSTTAVLKEPLQEDISHDRMQHILGRYEGIASDYYASFKANDHAFCELPLRSMSKLTHNLMRGIDYDMAKKKRNENFLALAVTLSGINALDLIVPDGPYAYPLYYKDGMRLKKILAEHKIYVATLWPNVLLLDECMEKDYAENILPLPCDQRYSREDMTYIVSVIMKHAKQ